MRGDLTARAGRAVSAALLAVLAGLTLIVGAAGTASAAGAPARPAVAAEVLLSPQQATEFTRQVEAAAVRPMVHPSCVDDACGVMLSPSETQALWKAVVNKPLQTVRQYCEGLFGGLLRPFCAKAAQFLSNLSAPNGRCLFIGLAPAPNGSKIAVKYTKVDCY
ncbi:hypothetical protein [Amycolatopsis sp. NPDC021455]|uniref:hypothetical protein n=1 Tax=Amycolatopsis sp. NPDC021455 TaxID=3154901 RepID=UPI0033D59812